MVRSFLILFLLIIASGCKTMNQITIDKRINKRIMYGQCDREVFNNDELANWFYVEYENYNVDKSSLTEIRGELYDFKLVIVMGSWCGDSRREVPRFFKILDDLAYPEEQIELYGVNREKKCLDIDTELLNIEYVPTFIIIKDNEEIGRIIESPEASLEKDLSAIVKENL